MESTAHRRRRQAWRARGWPCALGCGWRVARGCVGRSRAVGCECAAAAGRRGAVRCGAGRLTFRMMSCCAGSCGQSGEGTAVHLRGQVRREARAQGVSGEGGARRGGGAQCPRAPHGAASALAPTPTAHWHQAGVRRQGPALLMLPSASPPLPRPRPPPPYQSPSSRISKCWPAWLQ